MSDTARDDKQRIKTIVAAITAEESRLRVQYPVLQRQDTLGLLILLLSIAGMVGVAALYHQALISAWLCVLLAAFFASLSHELEHDLIHFQYFRNKPLIHNGMMLLVWLMRPNTVNPWYRRKIHLLHHKVSGTEQDLEERLVGNGLPNGVVRCLVMLDGLASLVLQCLRFHREVKAFSLVKILLASFPLTLLFYLSWHSVLAWQLIELLFAPGWVLPLSEPWLHWGQTLLVALIIPNVLRSVSLNIVTSYSHYYGGVNTLMQQTQVLTPWFMLPLQLFCFNFGATHSIHHFVYNQPFYIRQLVAAKAHKVMKKEGLRFNDYASFGRNNCFQVMS